MKVSTENRVFMIRYISERLKQIHSWRLVQERQIINCDEENASESLIKDIGQVCGSCCRRGVASRDVLMHVHYLS